MNKNEALQQAKQLKSTIEKAQKELKELEEVINKPANGLWKPTEDEVYFFVFYESNDKYGVRSDTWSYHGLDHKKYYNNNCFQTEKEAWVQYNNNAHAQYIY